MPTHTDGVADDFDALAAYLRQHASGLTIDPDRIAAYAASGNAYRGGRQILQAS